MYCPHGEIGYEKKVSRNEIPNKLGPHITCNPKQFDLGIFLFSWY